MCRGEAGDVQWWGWWCPEGRLVMSWGEAGDFQRRSWWCAGVRLVMSRSEAGDVQEWGWWCPEARLVMSRSEAGDVQGWGWWCPEVAECKHKSRQCWVLPSSVISWWHYGYQCLQDRSPSGAACHPQLTAPFLRSCNPECWGNNTVDQSLVEAAQGMSPNKEEHGTFFDIEPHFGMPLHVDIRFQLTVNIEPIKGIPTLKVSSQSYYHSHTSTTVLPLTSPRLIFSRKHLCQWLPSHGFLLASSVWDACWCVFT